MQSKPFVLTILEDSRALNCNSIHRGAHSSGKTGLGLGLHFINKYLKLCVPKSVQPIVNEARILQGPTGISSMHAQRYGPPEF